MRFGLNDMETGSVSIIYENAGVLNNIPNVTGYLI